MKNTTLLLLLAVIISFTLTACVGDDTAPKEPPVANNPVSAPEQNDPVATPDNGGDNSGDDSGDNLGDEKKPDETIKNRTVNTFLCQNDKGFSGVAIVFSAEWGADFLLEESDISDLTVYKDGTPIAVSGFYISEWVEILDEPRYSHGVAAYHIWFDKSFDDYPAEYNTSVKIKGTQLNQIDFGTFIINADGSFDMRW